MNSLIPHYYNEDALNAALNLGASLALKDLREVLIQLPTKVETGGEYDTVDKTTRVMREICDKFIAILKVKIDDNLEQSEKQVTEIARERDGV